MCNLACYISKYQINERKDEEDLKLEVNVDSEIS